AELCGHHPGMMLLPRFEHRLPAIREMKLRFIADPNRYQKGDYGGSVGVVGVVGLLAAVGAALFPRAGADRPSVLGRFGALAVVLLALGTIGGLGSLFAFFVSPKIRGYERVSVYLGFL